MCLFPFLAEAAGIYVANSEAARALLQISGQAEPDAHGVLRRGAGLAGHARLHPDRLGRSRPRLARPRERRPSSLSVPPVLADGIRAREGGGAPRPALRRHLGAGPRALRAPGRASRRAAGWPRTCAWRGRRSLGAWIWIAVLDAPRPRALRLDPLAARGEHGALRRLLHGLRVRRGVARGAAGPLGTPGEPAVPDRRRLARPVRDRADPGGGPRGAGARASFRRGPPGRASSRRAPSACGCSTSACGRARSCRDRRARDRLRQRLEVLRRGAGHQPRHAVAAAGRHQPRRTERLRQDDAPEPDDRPGPPEPRAGLRPRHEPERPGEPSAARSGTARRSTRSRSGATGRSFIRDWLRALGHGPRRGRPRRRGGARARGHDRGRRPQGRGLQQGHAPADPPGAGAQPSARGAGARRAAQRPRPDGARRVAGALPGPRARRGCTSSSRATSCTRSTGSPTTSCS